MLPNDFIGEESDNKVITKSRGIEIHIFKVLTFVIPNLISQSTHSLSFLKVWVKEILKKKIEDGF